MPKPSLPFWLMVIAFYAWFLYRILFLPGMAAYTTLQNVQEMVQWSEKFQPPTGASDKKSPREKKRSPKERAQAPAKEVKSGAEAYAVWAIGPLASQIAPNWMSRGSNGALLYSPQKVSSIHRVVVVEPFALRDDVVEDSAIGFKMWNPFVAKEGRHTDKVFSLRAWLVDRESVQVIAAQKFDNPQVWAVRDGFAKCFKLHGLYSWLTGLGYAVSKDQVSPAQERPQTQKVAAGKTKKELPAVQSAKQQSAKANTSEDDGAAPNGNGGKNTAEAPDSDSGESAVGKATDGPKEKPASSAEDAVSHRIAALRDRAAARETGGASAGPDGTDMAKEDEGARRAAEKSYQQKLHDHVAANWTIPELVRGKGLEAVAHVTLDRHGQVRSYNVKKSGNQVFDRSVEKAISDSTPFPRMPPAMRGATFECDLRFSAP